MSQHATLGVDIGTSSSKGVLVAPDGTVLRATSRAHTVDRPAPGHVEMDAHRWWAEFVDIATELTGPGAGDRARSGTHGADAGRGDGNRPARDDSLDVGNHYMSGDVSTDTASISGDGDGDVVVDAVGVSGMGPCVLLTDDAGQPLRPAILYGVDTRATTQIADLNAALGRDEVLATCGSVLTTQAAGPKIAWIREHEPDVYARARRLFMPASYLAFRLTGSYRIDHHSASQCTPLYDTTAQEWHPRWAPLVAPGIALPELGWPGEAAGVTSAPIAGVPAGTPVTIGTIDAWSEAVSVDAQNPGDLMLMYGTTMFLVATTPEPVTCESMWGTVGAYPGTRNLAGGMATSGAITSWLAGLTGTGYPELLAEAEASGVGARGLLTLPYFAGERTPIADPDARGVVVGLTLTHTRGDLYRSALEATAFGIRHNVETMRAAGADVRRVVAVGGGTQGGLWTQIVSDVTGLEQVVPTTTIGASYGAAALAAGLVGRARDGRVDVGAWNPPAHVVRPHLDVRDDYDELYGLYRSLYPATRDIAHALARWQDRP